MNQFEIIKRNIKELRPGLTTRFAPSPTGYLHLGHVLSAIFVWGIAESIQGKTLIRIEDHDQSRCRDEYMESIQEDLEWLGFLGLDSCQQKIEIQSQNFPRFEKHLASIQQIIYACDCSRKKIKESMKGLNNTTELRYNNHCRSRNLPFSKGTGVRCILDNTRVTWVDLCLGEKTQSPQSQCGDLLIKDRDGQWTYQYSVVLDDILQNVDLVIRGQDLTDSTARQILLAKLLGRETPPIFLHHPLILDEGGKKLSKRDKASSIRDLKEQGMKPEEVLGLAAWQGGILQDRGNLRIEQIGSLFHD